MLAEASLLVALTVHRGPGAEACLSETKLRRGVEQRLRRRVFAEPGRAQLRFVVTYTKRDGKTEARIEVASADGTPRGSRSLVTANHCSALDDSLALSVALLVDQPPEPEPSQPGPPAPVTTASPLLPLPPRDELPPFPSTTITVPAEVAAPREPWHLAMGAALQGAWGVLPGVAPALSLALRVSPRHFVPTSIQGEGFAFQSAERDGESGARFRLLRVGLAICPPLLRAATRDLALCFGQKVGWLRVDGFGFDHDLAERRLTYALNVGLEARQHLFSRLSLRGYVGAEVPLVRDRFVSSGRNASELFRASPVALAAEVGLEAALW